MAEKENQKYYLGLDMGTSSVGWAVTDSGYHLLRSKGKDMWGVRLFDEADTSAERRGYRTARRRRQREIARLGILRELFADAIAEVDEGFFMRLDDSKFFMEERREDNKQPFALFADSKYTDKEYYKDYPTIFHLQKELIESDKPHDIRLVYLALANMFKHRGHFLNNTLGTSEEQSTDFTEAYQNLAEIAEDYGISLPLTVDVEEIKSALSDNTYSKSVALQKICEITGVSKKEKAAYQLLNMMCGLKAKMTDIFGELWPDEESKLSVSFRDSNYEENELKLRELLGDSVMELISAVKSLHDIGLLANILKDKPYLCYARVDTYEEHHRDLELLKRVLKRYDMKDYHEMFRVMKEGNYSAYIGSVNSDRVIRRHDKGKVNSQEELCKNIEKIVKNFPSDDVEVEEIRTKVANGTFLPKQLTASNGVIPNQVHVRDMKAILRNASAYLPFLKEKDDTGLTVADKILQVFSFRIPYYVGPLGQEYKDKKGYNVWAERKDSGKIYPWNLEQKVDFKLTAEKFIERMVRHCTYLGGEKALPKQSLLYEKFEVLNELNNLKINGEKPSVGLKQEIYNNLFLKGKKVTLKQLETFLRSKGILTKEDTGAISGIDNGFNSSLSSHGKFLGVLGEAALYDENRKMIEDIIFWGTVYGEDKKFLKERITEQYREKLTDSQIKRILGFKFIGWGRLSQKFLDLEGVSKQDGEVKTLIRALWEENVNLMELMSDGYTYKDSLDDLQIKREKPLSDWNIDDLDDLYLSAPVKRMVWQTMRILAEIRDVLGFDPDRIFVEMAREDGEKGVRKQSRKNKLLELYRNIGKESAEWRKELEDTPERHFSSKKLYLYYLQQGRCMYTGEEINLADLMNDNLYDIDHIYPRHFVKDDSIENNLVLVKKEKNAHKSDNYPIEASIRNGRKDFWRSLAEKGFITKEKYNRLVRNTKFTEEEKAAFISRQLVETRQGTKAITQIIQQAFPETKVVFSKAGNVSDFRHEFQLYKVRSINDFHHAHDAYLNIVVGNVYYVKFTSNPLNFIREGMRKSGNKEYEYHMSKIFDYTVKRGDEVAWSVSDSENEKTISVVKRMMNKTSPIITQKSYEVHGGITGKATIYGSDVAKEQGYLPVKLNDPRLQDVTKYGGITSITTGFYTLVQYDVKGKTIRSLEAIPSYLGRSESISEETILAYLEKTLALENKGKKIENLSIRKKVILFNSLIKYNGYFYYLGGKTNRQIYLKNGVSLCLDRDMCNYIKKIEKALVTDYYEEKDKERQLIITKEKNNKLFSKFVSKYNNSIFVNRIGAVGEVINKNQDMFVKLSLKEQCFVLNQLLQYSQLSGIDLSLIGGSSKTGVMLISKKFENVKEAILINQSATGLFQTEIDLLTV